MSKCATCDYPLPEWYKIPCPQCARDADGIARTAPELVAELAPINTAPFLKSEREVAIDRLCKAVMTATPEERQRAEWNLVNFIEGTDA